MLPHSLISLVCLHRQSMNQWKFHSDNENLLLGKDTDDDLSLILSST